MNLLVALGLGVLAGTGVWLLLRARSFDLILGITLLSYAVNFFIFTMGRLKVDGAPILAPELAPTLENYADPLPQALVLTAIVIGFAMTALMLVIALRTHLQTGSDHVDSVTDRNGDESAAIGGDAFPPGVDGATTYGEIDARGSGEVRAR